MFEQNRPRRDGSIPDEGQSHRGQPPARRAGGHRRPFQPFKTRPPFWFPYPPSKHVSPFRHTPSQSCSAQEHGTSPSPHLRWLCPSHTLDGSCPSREPSHLGPASTFAETRPQPVKGPEAGICPAASNRPYTHPERSPPPEPTRGHIFSRYF